MMRAVSAISSLLSLLLVACTSPATPDVGKSPAAKEGLLPVSQVIVKYKPSANLASAAAAGNPAHMRRLSDAAGVPLAYLRPMSGDAHLLRLPQRMEIGRVQEICARIAALPDVEYAEPDYMMRATGN